MLVNGILGLVSAIVLIFSMAQIRHRLPCELAQSDKILIKLCWLVVARLMIIALYHIPVSLEIMDKSHYYFQYLFKAYSYADLLTSVVGLVFSYYLYTKYYGNERTT